jgi:hypothetical protein
MQRIKKLCLHLCVVNADESKVKEARQVLSGHKTLESPVCCHLDSLWQQQNLLSL